MIAAYGVKQPVEVGHFVKINTTQEFNKEIGNAGYDLRSSEKTILEAGKRMVVKTGIRLEMPNDMVAKIESRSGLAAKGIDARGGVIDACYRGEIGVILHNTSTKDFEIEIGDRIAQLLFLPILHPVLVRCADLSESNRGERGFGSSGLQ